MSIVTRTQLVAALAKSGAAIMLEMTPAKMHLLHMAVGISGEAAELAAATDRENLIEELGDIKFYEEGLLQGLGTTLDQLQLIVLEDTSVADICIQAGEVLDIVKKVAIYGRTVDYDTLLGAITLLASHIAVLEKSEGITDQEIHAKNLGKLGRRYSDLRYSNEAALARADKESEGVKGGQHDA